MSTAVPHGTRNCYKAGCKSLPCRAANASYQQRLRRLKRQGKTPLGAIVPAGQAAYMVKTILAERYRRQQLQQYTGLERHSLNLTPARKVRLSTVLRVKRAYRMMVGHV